MKDSCVTCGHYDLDFHFCDRKVQEMGKDNWLDPDHEPCLEWKKRPFPFRVGDKVLEVK